MIISDAGANFKVVFSPEEIEKDECGFVQQDEDTRIYFISLNVWMLMQENRCVRKLLNSIICEKLSISEAETGKILENNDFGSSINIIDRNGRQECSFKLGCFVDKSEQIMKSYTCKLSTYETMIINNYIKNIDACIENENYEKAQNVISN